jgi:GTP cyclohydrolase IA
MSIIRQELAVVSSSPKSYLSDHAGTNVSAVIRDAVVHILRAVGENPDREGLRDTPERVARMYVELLGGYGINPTDLINGALFVPEEVRYSEMIIVSSIDYSSLCEHHLLPFTGQAYVAYIPNEKVIGLSKIPRVVEMFARRLQIQERLTQQIADFLTAELQPVGVGVVVDGIHACSTIRGVKKPNTKMTTAAMTGAFKDCEKTRAEFMAHLDRISRV